MGANVLNYKLKNYDEALYLEQYLCLLGPCCAQISPPEQITPISVHIFASEFSIVDINIDTSPPIDARPNELKPGPLEFNTYPIYTPN